MLDKPISQYLDNYAEAHIGLLDALINRELKPIYQSVLVIPAHDESPESLESILPADISDTLIIVVVNSSEDSNLLAIKRTQAYFQYFYTGEAQVAVIPRDANTTLLLVDCCRKGRQLPKKQGVGLARKIGCDLALACIHKGIVATPWIHCTDADVLLPSDYFSDEDLGEDVAVAIYPFVHTPPHQNILLYEISLRYYVNQLNLAGSPYGFHTIGSLLKINALHYAMVRGFPKRQAAEDFYLLNKLAKVGKVARLKAPRIRLSSRISPRVPFGTGATMRQLAQNRDLLFYDPEIFKRLGTWLKAIAWLWSDRHEIRKFGLAQWWKQVGWEDEILLKTILELGLEKVLPNAYRQCQDYQHFQFFIWIWFDGFRTLKFVHYLRDNYLPSLTLEEVIPSIGKQFNSLLSTESLNSLRTLQQINEMFIWQENQWSCETGPTICINNSKSY